MLHDVKEIPAGAGDRLLWRQSARRTSERGSDSAHSNLRGINDAQGRLMVVMTRNTDIADTWGLERAGNHGQYFERFSPRATRFGVNIVVAGAMTH